ncbi:hypothetical protein ACHAXA_003905, partial [Cyclostephanos tholiformis]
MACKQLSEIVLWHEDIVKNYLRLSHFNGHGLRKDVVSIAARGEWLIGKILDLYFRFTMGGDRYLGLILALLDPSKETFSILQPNWKDQTYQAVLRGIKLCFGVILAAHSSTSHNPSEVNVHIPMAMGVPPHVEHQQAIKEVHTVCIETRNTVTQFRNDIEKAIFEAVDAKVASEGGVNLSIL